MANSNNWQSSGSDGYQQQITASRYEAVQRAGDSIHRSLQIAVETEQIGAQVLSDLDNQHESLLRSSARLESTEKEISQSGAIIKRLRRQVLHNRIVLILIIVVELLILVGLVIIKFVRK